MSAQIQSLQDQVNDLYGQLSALRGGAPAPYSMQHALPQEAPTSYRNAVSPSQSRGTHTQFQGPTSNQYNFNVAKSSLQTMGISESEVADDGVGNDIDPALGAPVQQQAPMAPMVTQFQKDPLWQLSKAEAIRLCRVYDEEMGTMYPLFDMEKMINHAQLLFTFTESAARNGLMRRDKPGFEAIQGRDANIVKMILANALTIEEYGRSQLGKEIYDSCREQIESRLTGPVEMRGLILLVMAVSTIIQTRIEFADGHFRRSTTFIKMKRSRLTVLLALLLVSVSNWDFTVATPSSISFPVMKTAHGLSSSSGPFMHLTEGGALVQECPLPYRTPISTRIFQNR